VGSLLTHAEDLGDLGEADGRGLQHETNARHKVFDLVGAEG
jgi:hypothetical protein